MEKEVRFDMKELKKALLHLVLIPSLPEGHRGNGAEKGNKAGESTEAQVLCGVAEGAGHV